MDQPGTYLQWGFVSVSVGNLIIIVLMLTIFVVALFAPFPPGGRR
jgi:hypothetical protein